MMGRLNHDQEQFFYSFRLRDCRGSRPELGAFRIGALLSPARSTITWTDRMPVSLRPRTVLVAM